jgi:hypothetical protein
MRRPMIAQPFPNKLLLDISSVAMEVKMIGKPSSILLGDVAGA